MKRESRVAPPVPQAESPLRQLPLLDLLVNTKTELLELALRSGLKVFTAMLEEDRTAICGPRHAHEPDRGASRAGTTERSGPGPAEGDHPVPGAPGRQPARSRCRPFRRWRPPIRSMGVSLYRCWSAWPHGSTRGAGAARSGDEESCHEQSAVSRRFVARTTAQFAASLEA